MLRDLNDISENFSIESDVCIVGSGAAGLAVALEFNNKPYKVVVLESGGFDIQNGTHAPFNIVSAGEHTLDTLTRIRALGGTLNMWGGALKVLDEIDFEKRFWLPYSGWPISYAEVEKYWNITANRYHLPPLHFHQVEHWLSHIKITDERKMLHKDIHINITNSLAKPLNFRTNYHHELATSRNIHIYLKANTTHLKLNNSCKRIQAIKAKTVDGKLLTCKARYFILAAGGIENAALLLNSHDKMAKGVGNQNDLVGRFYMNHPKGDLGILVPYNRGIQLPHFFGSSSPYGRVMMGLSPSRALMEKEHLLNHCIQLVPVYQYETLSGYESAVVVRHIFGKSRIRSWISRHVKKTLNKIPKLGCLKYLVIHNHLEQAPNPNSRVFLSDELDIFGNQRAALDWRISLAEKESIKKFHDILRCCLQGVGQLHSTFEETDCWPISIDAAHHMGTTRMALSERDGVVDKDCKVFGLDNLFVAGSSVFPTGGNANPTFTILALSIRLADHLKRKLSSQDGNTGFA